MLWCVVVGVVCDVLGVGGYSKYKAYLFSFLLVGVIAFFMADDASDFVLLALLGLLLARAGRRFNKETASVVLMSLVSPVNAEPAMGQGAMMGGQGNGNPQDFIVSGSLISERVIIDNVSYWHQILGDPNDGFSLEIFIRASGPRQSAGFVPAIAEGICGGGMGGMGGGGMGGGGMGGGGGMMGGGGGDCNGAHPLDPLYGASSANPSEVIMRQIVSDNEMMMEVSKPLFAMKHRISQTLTDGDMMANFILDGSAIAINETAVKADITNTFELLNGFEAPFDERWDIAVDGQNVDYSAAQWRYIPGTCADCFDGGGGTYDYGSGGTFDQYNAPWESFFNQPQDPSNFWTLP